METNTEQKAERLSADLIFGAENIAQEMGIEVSKVYYLHRKRMLPIRKLGKVLVVSRRQLRRAFEALPQT